MADETTARMTLPLLQPGQAQKEMFHNEALALIDLALQAQADGIADMPPAVPAPGECWIVGPAPGGAWQGHAGALAGWTGGGWRFLAAREGMAVALGRTGVQARFRDGSWEAGVLEAAVLRIDGRRVVGAQQPALADPTGGSIVDGEARETLAGVLAVLRAHGLISTA